MTSPLLLTFLLFSEPHRALTKKVAQVVPNLFWPLFWDIVLEDIPQLFLPLHIVSTRPHWEVDTLTVVSLSGSAVMTILNLIRVFVGCRESAKVHLAELKRGLKTELDSEIKSMELGDSNNNGVAHEGAQLVGAKEILELRRKDMDQINDLPKHITAHTRLQELRKMKEIYEDRISSLENMSTAQMKEIRNMQEAHDVTSLTTELSRKRFVAEKAFYSDLTERRRSSLHRLRERIREKRQDNKKSGKVDEVDEDSPNESTAGKTSIQIKPIDGRHDYPLGYRKKSEIKNVETVPTGAAHDYFSDYRKIKSKKKKKKREVVVKKVKIVPVVSDNNLDPGENSDD